MTVISTIALNTFREAVRDRILYAILGFGALFILLDIFIARLALGDLVMIRSFGLAGIYLFGMIMTIFLGSSLISKEIERRTLYFVLSKPVSRKDVVLGKFFGLFAAVTATTLLMAILYLGVIGFEGGGFDGGGLLSIFFQILEQGFFIAMLVFFSSVISPLSATLCSVMVLFLGHLLTTALQNARQMGGAAYTFISGLYYLFPNLEKFDIRALVVHHGSVSWQMFGLTLGYMAVYAIVLLTAAVLCLERREL